MLSHRHEISEDYSQRRALAGHGNTQKCVISLHTDTHTSDLERFTLLSTLLYLLHSAEHNHSLIKGAEIKNPQDHRQVHTGRENWTDSKVLHPSAYSPSLLIVHFTLQCALHVLLQLISLVTFCISVDYSKKYMREERKPEMEKSGCVSTPFKTQSLPIHDLYWLIYETASPPLSLWPRCVPQSRSQHVKLSETWSNCCLLNQTERVVQLTHPAKLPLPSRNDLTSPLKCMD